MSKALQPFASLTAKAIFVLLCFVTVGILVVAALAYSELVDQTEENANIRIDRAARAASVIVEHRLGDVLTIQRNARGIPERFVLKADALPHQVAGAAAFDALVKEIGATNQGAANVFSWNSATQAFDRFATTFRLPNGNPPPPMPIAVGHPGYAPSIAGLSIKGHMPAMGRFRLACLVPIVSPAGQVVGIFSVDVGWVDDLVSARDRLRTKLAYSVLFILIACATAGAWILRLQLKPLRVMAHYAHGLAEGRMDVPAPYRERHDEIGWLAEGLGRVATLQDRLEVLAYTDPITSLGNRSRFLADLAEALTRARDGKSTALVMLDLDHFKQVNDAHGHQVGDDMLRAVARRITTVAGANSRAARIGGDEFAVLVPDAELDSATRLCEQLITALARPVILPQGEIYTKASIGVALLPKDADTGEAAYRNAGLALRRSKAEGRGRTTFFDESHNDTAQRSVELARRLRLGLDEHQLSLHFQPQINSHSLELYGLEALLRWNEPTIGPISPVEFIPVAESNGLIVEIGYFVLDEACRVGRRWIDEGFAFPHISVNVSAIQLWQPDFLDEVARTLTRHRFPATKLCIEVTESVLVNQSESRIMDVLSRLRDLGTLVALDDFGSGYSSLGYLNRLPLDQLKVDREFVKNIDSDTRKQRVLSGIVALGHGLELEIVAEGAETAAEVDFLRRIGCEAIQGFHFGRPAPADDVVAQVARLVRDKVDNARPLVGAHDPLLKGLRQSA